LAFYRVKNGVRYRHRRVSGKLAREHRVIRADGTAMLMRRALEYAGMFKMAVIDHCEMLRYRFAVLDSTPEPTDTISDAQNQRQQYDTKYAAIYHPWLLIPPPFPVSAGAPDEYPIPPSGHVVGIYARTDVERGVHKAPANEVVMGANGLAFQITQAEQGGLNKVGINCIRAFPGRGIRVWGARTLSSDPAWRYINVRRLFNYIEESVIGGTQWVVFEPNDLNLWQRV
jgi:phage tail sheath protein FI